MRLFTARALIGVYSIERGGAVVAAAVSVLLFGCWGVHGALSRDEAVYAYGGQQFAHGVPPYASIFDPKTPGATLLAGIAALLARLLGRNDLYVIRGVFFVCSCLAAIAVYLLALELFRSVLGAVVAAVVFASFTGFAEDALSGPDAKTPGVLACVLAMWLLVRRRWFWGGCAAGVATVVWQPFLPFPIAAVLAAVVVGPTVERSHRVRSAVAGVLLPWAVVVGYFAATGALSKLAEAALVFPLTGVVRAHMTIGGRISHIATVVHHYYGFSGYLLAVGAVGLVALVLFTLRNRSGAISVAVKDPIVVVVMSTMLFEYGYAALDFQGYQDVYPLLPYAAVGFAGLVAVALQRMARPVARKLTAVIAAGGAIALVVVSTIWFVNESRSHLGLAAEESAVCAIDGVIGRDGALLALGDPTPLVLSHRRNPDRYIYLDSGVARWKLTHLNGGFAGWTRQITAWHPDVIVSHAWSSRMQHRMDAWLRNMGGYQSAYLGAWQVYLTPAAAATAQTRGVELTSGPARDPGACCPGAGDTTGTQRGAGRTSCPA